MRYCLFVFLSLALSGTAWGQLSYTDDRYFYLQGDYVDNSRLENNMAKAFGITEEKGDGYGFELSTSLTPHALFMLDYHTVDGGGGEDMTTAALGLGLRTAPVDFLDLYGIVTYEYLDPNDPTFNADSGGVGLRAGLRFFLVDNLELMAEARIVEFGEEFMFGEDRKPTARLLRAGIIWTFYGNFALTGQYLAGEYEFKGATNRVEVDRKDVRVGIRWYFAS